MSNNNLSATDTWPMDQPTPMPFVEDWKGWCRLCAKANAQYINVLTGHSQQQDSVDVFLNSKYSVYAIVMAIEEFFRVHITEDEKLSPLLCTACYQTVVSFIRFSENIKKVQQLYNDLQYSNENSNLNLQALYEKYGLFQEEEEEESLPLESMANSLRSRPARSHSSKLPVEEIFFAESTTSRIQKPLTSKLKIKNEQTNDETPTRETKIKRVGKKDVYEDPFGEEECMGNEKDFLYCELRTDTPPPPKKKKMSNTQAKNTKGKMKESDGDDDGDDDGDYNDDDELYEEESEDEGEDEYDDGHKDDKGESDDDDTSEEETAKPKRKSKSKRKTKKKSKLNEDIEESDDDSVAEGNKKKSIKKRIPCNICGQTFKRTGNYSVHMKKKHGILVCPHCSNSFDSEESLKRHIKEHKTLYPCPHCDRKFQVKEYVAQHIKFVHEDERPFICDVCGDAVRTKGQLKEHMLTHTDYAPFECKECGKCFKQKQRLKRHMQIHGEKHICSVCGKELSTRATLNSHLLVHSDKMPHKCDYCGRLFKRAKTLKNHLIAHTGLRPYTCDFCGKTFSTGPSCRFHKKTMHPAEVAAMEAAGVKTYTKNIPNLDVLRAVSRTAENLTPLASKQNGCVFFDKKKEQENAQEHENENSAESPIAMSVI